MIDEKWILVSFALLGCWQCTSGARILAFFPMPWRSHHSVFKPLVKELANRGHSVDYFTPLPMTNPPKGLRQLVVKDWQEEAMKDFDEEEWQAMSPFNVQRFTVLVSGQILDKTFNFDQVSIDLLKSNETYDLVLTEFAVGNEPAVYLAHKFKAYSVAIMGFTDYPWINELAGLPDNPSYMVSYLNPLTDSLTFSQRLYNTYVSASVVLSGYYDLFVTQQPRADRIMRYEGWETRPKLLEMIGETALILTDSHPSTSSPYPKAPHVKEIAGMHLDPDSQPMPKELQDFMDDAPHGVIFFSLGSVLDPAQLLKDRKFDIFLNVFKKLKQKVMWKIAPGLPEVKDPKFKVQTWFPQQGILGHKNLKMFITHAGLQSTIESISFGVPCLAIPFVYDQFKDAAFMEKIGMAIRLDFEDITETSLSRGINEILYNSNMVQILNMLGPPQLSINYVSKETCVSGVRIITQLYLRVDIHNALCIFCKNGLRYRENAMKQKAVFEDRPRKPVEEAAFWIEYVLRHGTILRPASATMPLYQVYLLDVIATVAVAIVVLLWLLKRVLWILLQILGLSSKNTMPIKKKTN